MTTKVKNITSPRPGKAPSMPPGIEAHGVSFAGTNERPRREYFLTGTAQSQQSVAPAAARRPRIISPVGGSVFALDPDIPLGRQAMAIGVSGEVAGHRLMLDRRYVGAAGTSPLILAGPGVHHLSLVDAGRKVVDRARFTVR